MQNNSLANYLNRDLKKVISQVQVVQGTAKDTGNIYYALEITLINGYTKRLFLRSDEQFAWINGFDLLDTNNMLDQN